MQVPKLLELVGLGYTSWFVYRYLLFKVCAKGLLISAGWTWCPQGTLVALAPGRQYRASTVLTIRPLLAEQQTGADSGCWWAEEEDHRSCRGVSPWQHQTWHQITENNNETFASTRVKHTDCINISGFLCQPFCSVPTELFDVQSEWKIACSPLWSCWKQVTGSGSDTVSPLLAASHCWLLCLSQLTHSESACAKWIHEGVLHHASHRQTDVLCGVFVQGDFFIRQYLIQKSEQDKQCHCWRQAQRGSVQDCRLGPMFITSCCKMHEALRWVRCMIAALHN